MLILSGCNKSEDDGTDKTTTGQTISTTSEQRSSTISTTEITSEETTTSESSSSENEITDGRYITSLFNETTVQTVVYHKGVNEKGDPAWLRLDVYTPEGDEEINRPVIIWLHGGGFVKGNDRTQGYIVTLAQEFTKRGYVSISANYSVRAKPEDDMEGTITDAVDDEILPFGNSQKLQEILTMKDVRCELLPLDGVGHTPVDEMDTIIQAVSDFMYSLILD